jgi:hypothetical protein
MKKTIFILIGALGFALLALLPQMAKEAGAQSSYYTSKNCSSCHGSTSTCNGCHSHGVHSSPAGSDINLKATPNKTTYAPGESMQVTLTGGNKTGWFRATLFDQTGAEVVRARTSFPATLTATAPSAAGSYTWKMAWYGNAYDGGSAGHGDWIPDPNNSSPQHGWEKVSFTFQVASQSAPAITVTDSVSPNNDLTVPFGSLAVGSTATQTVTVRNDGNANLIIGPAGISNPLAAPFNIQADNCSGKTIAPAGTCTITLKFAPVSAGTFSDSFNIPSNDPGKSSVTMNVSGMGTGVSTPRISVSDSVAPAEDLSVPFGSVTAGNSAKQTVTVMNTGTAGLLMGQITPPSSPFTVETDGCSRQTVAPQGTCTVGLVFAPTTEGASSSTLKLPSNDPNTPEVIVAVSGMGLSAAMNNPPCKPKLLFPAQGQHGLGQNVEFRWQVCRDPDGDEVEYDIEIDNDNRFGDDGEVPEVDGNVKFYGGLASSLGLLFVGLAFIGRMRTRRRLALFALFLVIAAILLVSCGGGGGGTSPATSEMTQQVNGLETGTTYYWRVTGNDGHGNIVTSDVANFSTE